jgi:ATP-dependent DNA ligase
MENTARCWLFISFRSKIVKHISPSFNSDDWLFEIKHDGFRVLSIRDGGPARLSTRKVRYQPKASAHHRSTL